MKKHIETFKYKDKEVMVYLERKFIRGAYARFSNDEINVSAPHLWSRSNAVELATSLFNKMVKQGSFDRRSPIEQDVFLLFGVETLRDPRLDEKKLDAFLKEQLLAYLTDSVSKYKQLMGLTFQFNVKVRKMKTRWGVNSFKSKDVTFAFNLVHFSRPIIDAIVVHELAHFVVPNHSAKFYNLVNLYCQNYKKLHNELKKGNYGYGIN